MNIRPSAKGTNISAKEILLLFLLIASLFLFLLPCLSFGESVLYEGDSIYNHITVRENDSERCMLFGRHADNRETCIDLKEPDRSVFEYNASSTSALVYTCQASGLRGIPSNVPVPA
jgi:hypothetical protein